jgi:hypothetical protein
LVRQIAQAHLVRQIAQAHFACFGLAVRIFVRALVPAHIRSGETPQAAQTSCDNRAEFSLKHLDGF